MRLLYFDLIPTYVLVALLSRPLFRSRPTILGERWLAIIAGAVALTLWLLAIDVMFTQGIWSGKVWIVVAFVGGILLTLLTALLMARRMCNWVVLRVSHENAWVSIEKALQGLRFSYDIKLPSVLLNSPSGRITVRHIPSGFLWLTFKIKAGDPKFRLLKQVVRKFLVYGVPGLTR